MEETVDAFTLSLECAEEVMNVLSHNNDDWQARRHELARIIMTAVATHEGEKIV